MCESTSRRTRSFKKTGKQAIGKSKGGWNTKIHMVASSERNAVKFMLSGGEKSDAPEGRKLLKSLGKLLGKSKKKRYLLMDRAYEGDETRELAVSLGFIPVVPPKSNRKQPWSFDKVLYRKRNEVERIFNRIKRFRRIFTRYDKLDIIFDSLLFYVNRL